MQAVIMAGGKGSRLAGVLSDLPKPMVPVNGKPLLQYQIENLRDCGVSQIILVVGHLGNAIKDYFDDGSAFDVGIDYFTESKPLGTAGALVEMYDRLEDDFLLIFGDLMISVDFQRFMEFHQSMQAAATLFSHPNSHPYDSDIILTDKSSKITGWMYKDEERLCEYWNLVNAGLYVVNKSLLLGLPAHTKLDLEKDVIVPAIGKEDIYAYSSTEYVKDLGTPERLRKVEEDVQNGVVEQRNLKHSQKCIFLDRDGTINKYVGFLHRAEEVELEDGAAEAIRKLNSSGYLTVVITNQPVIARGETTVEELDRIHKKIHMLLGAKGAYLDAIYYCPHHPDKGYAGEVPELKIHCDCRKPGIGLLLQAQKDFNIDLNSSWFVGDTNLDVQTGINAGCKTALLRCGDMNKKYGGGADIETDSLLDAVNAILEVSL